MKAIYNLNDLSGIPPKMLGELAKHRDFFRNTETIEPIIENPKIAIVLRQIHEHCQEGAVVGYHYTNAIPEEILSSGLTCRRGQDIRTAFLNNYGDKFSSQEVKIIKEAWEKEFNMKVQAIRDSRLYFNYTTKEFGLLGSELLLNYYGGEQIYWPLHSLKNIGDKLLDIGVPMILKCVLDPKELKTYKDYTFGRIAISTYHCMLNPDAVRYDEDANQNVDVGTENIEIIYPDKIKKRDRI